MINKTYIQTSLFIDSDMEIDNTCKKISLTERDKLIKKNAFIDCCIHGNAENCRIAMETNSLKKEYNLYIPVDTTKCGPSCPYYYTVTKR